MNTAKLQQLKQRTQFLHGKNVGHCRQECPGKYETPSKKILLVHIDELGEMDTAVAQTLFSLAAEGAEQEAY